MADEDREPTLEELVPTMDGGDRMRVLSPDTPAEFREALLDFYRRQLKERNAAAGQGEGKAGPPTPSPEPEPQTGPKFDLQALRDEIDRATKVMGEAAELLRRRTSEPPSPQQDSIPDHPEPPPPTEDEPSPNKQPSRHPILGVVLGVIGTLILNELHVPLKFTVPLWIAVAICMWQWPRIVKTTPRLVSFWAALVVCLIIIIVYLVIQQTKLPPTSARLDAIVTGSPSPSIQNTPTVEQRTMLDVQPEDLFEFFKKYNSAQAKKLVEPYTGKWIRVTGRVSDVDRERHFNSPDTISVTIRPGTAGSYSYVVIASFDQGKWADRVLVLRRDERITVFGRITRIVENGLILDSCEVVE